MTPIALLNLSLLKIGQSKGITALDEASRAAWTGEQVYDHNLRKAMRAFPWPFATKYATLTMVQGPEPDWDDPLVQAWDNTIAYEVGDVVDLAGTFYRCILAHTGHTPPNTTYWSDEVDEDANGDWRYAYRWPDDCLFVRRVVPPGGDGRRWTPERIPFRVGRDTRGLLVYTNEPAAVIEYTMIDCDNLFTDDLFIDAFTWLLASVLAPSLSRDDKMAEKCYAMFQLTRTTAETVASQEQQLPEDGDSGYTGAR